MSLSFDKEKIARLLAGSPSIAVAVSGGPDSMALLYMLSRMAGKTTAIHALTFDHGLRRESAKEARTVGEWVDGWQGVKHHILIWTGKKPETGIMEQARKARYARMAKFCAGQGITQLWLGHHRTDQAETFLFRLAKGSGLDGLAAMSECQRYEKTEMMLIRPLLGVSKKEIEGFCRAQKIPHVKDPTNNNTDYARARLRQALPALEAEGLTEERLSGTIARLDRARQALDFYADNIISQAASIGKNQSTIGLAALAEAPMEMRIRVIRLVLARMGQDGYGPRLDRLEALLEDFFADPGRAKRFTLGGFLFASSLKKGLLTISREKKG